MKKIAFTGLVILLIYLMSNGVVGITLFPDTHTEHVQAVAMKAPENETFNQYWWYAFWAIFLVLPTAAAYAAIYRFLIVPARLRWADPATGLHPVEIKAASPLWKRALAAVGLVGGVDDVIHNYNNAHSPTWRVRENGYNLVVQADTHGLEQKEQIDYSMPHWGVRRTAARASGSARGPNRNEMLGESGYFDNKAKAEAAKAEAAMRRLTDQTPVQDDGDPIAPVEMLTLKQSVERSTPDAWIIGQNPDTGKLAYFKPDEAIHLAILGATGTGKTESTGMLVVGHALRNGYKVIILDGKGGADWSKFSRWSEYKDTDSSNFVESLTYITDEYERRTALIKAENAPTFRQLRNAPRPMLVLIEEYGDINDGLMGKVKDTANAMLNSLVRKARNTGIHLVFIDQYPEKWEAQLLNNTKNKVVYWLNDGTIVKEFKVYTLAEQGEFMLKGEKFRAWHVKPVVKNFLADVPLLETKEPFNRSFTPAFNGVHTPVGPPSVEQLNGERPTDLEAMVWGWRDRNPTGTQADLRKEFERQGIEISRGHVHNCWHSWSGNTSGSPSHQESGMSLNDYIAKYGEVRIGSEVVKTAVDKTQEIRYK